MDSPYGMDDTKKTVIQCVDPGRNGRFMLKIPWDQDDQGFIKWLLDCSSIISGLMMRSYVGITHL